MMELKRMRLDFIEEAVILEKGLLQDEEIKKELYKSPYTKEEVDAYLISDKRKESVLLKEARERASKTRWDRFRLNFSKNFRQKRLFLQYKTA